MRLFKSLLFMAALSAVVALSAGRAGAQAPQFHQEVKVLGMTMPGSAGEYFLTFSGPFSIPGVTLAEGTYLFRRPTHGVLQVLSSDRRHVYTQAFTVPMSRAKATDEVEVTFAEPSVTGAPQRVRAWYAPGETVGQELLYDQRRVGSGNSN
jgi:hypothetical protein